jgi:hypothetical protein
MIIPKKTNHDPNGSVTNINGIGPAYGRALAHGDLGINSVSDLAAYGKANPLASQTLATHLSAQMGRSVSEKTTRGFLEQALGFAEELVSFQSELAPASEPATRFQQNALHAGGFRPTKAAAPQNAMPRFVTPEHPQAKAVQAALGSSQTWSDAESELRQSIREANQQHKQRYGNQMPKIHPLATANNSPFTEGSSVAPRATDPNHTTQALFDYLGKSKEGKSSLRNLGAQIVTDDNNRQVIRINQETGTANNRVKSVYDIASDSKTGLITVNNADSPHGGFVVGNTVDFNTNQRTSSREVLSGMLGRTGSSGKSLVSMLQNENKSPFVFFRESTYNERSKLATRHVLTGQVENYDGSLRKEGEYSSDNIQDFVNRPQNADFVTRGDTDSVFAGKALTQTNFAMDYQGRFYGGKSVKREQIGGVHATLPLERWLGTPEAVDTLPARFGGQDEAQQGYNKNAAFLLQSGVILPEGGALVSKSMGHVGRTFQERVTLSPEQAKLAKEGDFKGALGYQVGTVFQFGNEALTDMNEADEIYRDQEGRQRVGAIPGLKNGDAGSYAHARISNLSYNEQDNTMLVQHEKYIPAYEASMKFRTKEHNMPVQDSYLNLNPLGGAPVRVDSIRHMPGAADAPTLALNSMLVEAGTTDNLRKQFSDEVSSNWRWSNEAGTVVHRDDSRYEGGAELSAKRIDDLFNGGVIGADPNSRNLSADAGGHNVQIYDRMARDYLKSKMTVIPFNDTRMDSSTYDLYKDATFEHNGEQIYHIDNERRQAAAKAGVPYEVRRDGDNYITDFMAQGAILPKMETFRPEYDRGRHTLRPEMLDNMKVANEGLYNNLMERASLGEFRNTAFDLTQAVAANSNMGALRQLENTGRIVNADDLGYAEHLGNISSNLSEGDKTVELLKSMAKGEHGDKAVSVSDGNYILPSPRSMLANITQDKSGELINTLGKKFMDTLSANEIHRAAVAGGGDGNAERQLLNSRARDTAMSAAELADKPGTIERAASIELGTLGGAAIAMPGLALNEVVMTPDQLFEMSGVHRLPENERAAARKLALESAKSGDMSFNATMFPHTSPDSVYPNLKISMLDDVRQRKGMEHIASAGNNLWVAPELLMHFDKDGDGDSIYGFANRTVVQGTDGKPRLTGQKLDISTDEQLRKRAAITKEWQDRADSAALPLFDRTGGEGFMEKMDDSRDVDSSKRTIRTFEEIKSGAKGYVGYNDMLQAKGQVGGLYNMSVRSQLPFARAAGDVHVRNANQEGREEAIEQSRQYSQSMGMLARYSYQKGVDYEKLTDRGISDVASLINSGKYDWARGNDQEAGYVDAQGNPQKITGGNTGIAAKVLGSVASYGIDQDDYSEAVAPHLARALLPLNKQKDEEAYGSMLSHLQDYKSRYDQAPVSERDQVPAGINKIANIAGFEGNYGYEDMVMGGTVHGKAADGSDVDDYGKQVPILNHVAAGMVDNMRRASLKENNPNMAANKGHRGINAFISAASDTFSAIKNYSNLFRKGQSGAVAAMHAGADAPDAIAGHTNAVFADMTGGERFSGSGTLAEETDKALALDAVSSVPDNLGADTPSSAQAASPEQAASPQALSSASQGVASVDREIQSVNNQALIHLTSDRNGNELPMRQWPKGAFKLAQSGGHLSIGLQQRPQQPLSASVPNDGSIIPPNVGNGGGGSIGEPPQGENSSPQSSDSSGGINSVRKRGDNPNTVINNIRNSPIKAITDTSIGTMADFGNRLEEYTGLLVKASDATKQMTEVEIKRFDALQKQFDISASAVDSRQRMDSERQIPSEGAKRYDKELAGSDVERFVKKPMMPDANGNLVDMTDVLNMGKNNIISQKMNMKLAALEPEKEDVDVLSLMTDNTKAGRLARKRAMDEDTPEGESPFDNLPGGRAGAGLVGGALRGGAAALNPGTLFMLRAASSMMVNPAMNAAQDYEKTQAERGLMQVQSGAMSHDELMDTEFGRIQRREANREQAHHNFGEQAYAAYAPVMDMVTNPGLAGSMGGAAAAIAGPAVMGGIAASRILPAMTDGRIGGVKAGLGTGLALGALALGSYAYGNHNNYQGIGQYAKSGNMFANFDGYMGTLANSVGLASETVQSWFGGYTAEDAQHYAKFGASGSFADATSMVASGGNIADARNIQTGGFFWNRATGTDSGTVGQVFSDAEIQAGATNQWIESWQTKGYNEESIRGAYQFYAQNNPDLIANGQVLEGDANTERLLEYSRRGIDYNAVISARANAQGVSEIDYEGRRNITDDAFSDIDNAGNYGGTVARESIWANTQLASVNSLRRVAGQENLGEEAALQYKDSPDQLGSFLQLQQYQANRAISNPYSQIGNWAGTIQGEINGGNLAMAQRLMNAPDPAQFAAQAYLSGNQSRNASMVMSENLQYAIAGNENAVALGDGFASSMGSFLSLMGNDAGLDASINNVQGFVENNTALYARGVDASNLASSRLSVNGQAQTQANLRGQADTLEGEITSSGFDVDNYEYEQLTNPLLADVNRGGRLSGRGNVSVSNLERRILAENTASADAYATTRQAGDSAAMAQDGFYTANQGVYGRLDAMAFTDPTSAMRLSGQMGQAQNLYQQYTTNGQSQSVAAANTAQLGMMNTQQFNRTNAAASGNQVVLTQMAQAGQIGSQFATMDLNTGADAFHYGIDSTEYGNIAQYAKENNLEYMLGSQSMMSGGIRGMQSQVRHLQVAQMGYQYSMQRAQANIGEELNMGGGTIGNDGFVVGGDGLAGLRQQAKGQGYNFNVGNGMSMWQIQDRNTMLGREKQDFGMLQQEQSLGLGEKGFDLSAKHFYEKWNLSKEKFDYGTSYQRKEMSIGRGQQLTQRQWQREDMDYNRNTSDLQFQWSMEDSDRGIKYARGRERLDLIRQKDRAVTMHSVQRGQMNKTEDRFEEQNKWADELFKRQKSHFEKQTDFTKEEMEMQKRHFEESRDMDKEKLEMQRDAFEKEKLWMKEGRELEDQQRLISRQHEEMGVEMARKMADAAYASQMAVMKLQESMQLASEVMDAQVKKQQLMAQTGELLNTILGQNGTAFSGFADLIKNNLGGIIGTIGNAMSAIQSSGGIGSAISGLLDSVGFADGGYTGDMPANQIAGVVHGKEYVVPENGSLVIRGDNSGEKLDRMVQLLEKIVAQGPGRVNATIHTNAPTVQTSALTAKDKAYSRIRN